MSPSLTDRTQEKKHRLQGEHSRSQEQGPSYLPRKFTVPHRGVAEHVHTF